MRWTTRLAVPSLLLTLLFCSCSDKDPNWKETYPVTGEIYVDGAPAAQLAVRCTDVNGLDKEQPTLSSAFTDEGGKFEISTYETGDGMPEGEYVLTFEWGQWNLVSGSYGGDDKLKGKYLDPKKSEHKFTVVEGEPTEIGRIDLKTKK